MRPPARLPPRSCAVSRTCSTRRCTKPNLVAGWRDHGQMEVNAAMLRNLMDALERFAKGLRHVTILQGTKAYGLHHVQVPVPAKERWPRAPHEVFYWRQEDLLRERQRRRLDLHRAASAVDPGPCRRQSDERHRRDRRIRRLDAGARAAPVLSGWRALRACRQRQPPDRAAAEFAATHPVAANETYNVVNGDMLVWQDVWPAIAAHFGMEVERPGRCAWPRTCRATRTCGGASSPATGCRLSRCSGLSAAPGNSPTAPSAAGWTSRSTAW